MKGFSKNLALSFSIRNLLSRGSPQGRTIATQIESPISSYARQHTSPEDERTVKRPLAILPFTSLLRSYAITSVSSSPVLLSPALKVLSLLANSPWAVLNPDRNPLLHLLLKRTFYSQFCAGETIAEVSRTIRRLKHLGYRGVILSYGKEIVLHQPEKSEAARAAATDMTRDSSEDEARDVRSWQEGTMKTVEMTNEYDFVALKFSGAGRDAMYRLANGMPPSSAIEQATVEICELAKGKGVGLLFDAEQHAVQDGIDRWTLDFQRRYNREKAVVYGTYQAYLRSAPETLVNHLRIAQEEAFVLGVKLVRGAYMASDPRDLFWASKEETDHVYDAMAEGLLERQWDHALKPQNLLGDFPQVELVHATHNPASVEKAMAIRKERSDQGKSNINVAFGQLMGMADEVSCDLLCRLSDRETRDQVSHAYKYVTWGSVGECLKYLVRRAEENRDAVTRAKGSLAALRLELLARLGIK